MKSRQRGLFVLLTLLLAAPLAGCGREPAGAAGGKGAAPDAAGRRVLLEVSTDASQTVYPPGRTLDLRLYESAEAEFDFYTRPDPAKVGQPFKAERRRATLSAEDVERIRKLLDALEQSDVKAEYGPTKLVLDSSVTKVVEYEREGRRKSISLKENDSHLLLDKKQGVYPQPLIDLLGLVEKINGELRGS